MLQYVIIRPSSDPGDPDLDEVRLSDIIAAASFGVMRNRAMRNADEGALSYIYGILQQWEERKDRQSTLAAQLTKEYGPPFERVLQALSIGCPLVVAQILSDEMDETLVALQQSGRFQEELEGYYPGSSDRTVKMDQQLMVTLVRRFITQIFTRLFLVWFKEGCDRYCSFPCRLPATICDDGTHL
jgi:hypothetical protein